MHSPHGAAKEGMGGGRVAGAKRIPEVDGLRCVAVLAVIAVHYRPPGMSAFDRLCAMGWVGVDIFFAISGFLITSILLSMRDAPHPFRTFYARRTVRIVPPYFVLLIVIWAVALSYHLFVPRMLGLGGFLFAPSLAPEPILVAFRHAFVTHQLDHTTSGIDLHQLHEVTEGLFVIWSLSIEEFFYLLWAPVALRARRMIVIVCAVLPILLCPVLRVLAHTSQFPEYTSFFFRVDSLTAGACLALLFAFAGRDPARRRLLSRALVMLLFLCAATLATMLWQSGALRGLEIRSTLLFAAGGYTALAVFSAAAVGLCAMHSGGGNPLLRLLRSAPVLYIGTVSYVVYLAHIPVYVLVRSTLLKIGLLHLPSLLVSLLSLGATILVAGLSWRYFERPLLSWKDRQFQRSLPDTK